MAGDMHPFKECWAFNEQCLFSSQHLHHELLLGEKKRLEWRLLRGPEAVLKIQAVPDAHAKFMAQEMSGRKR